MPDENLTCLFLGPLRDGEYAHPLAPCPVIGRPIPGGAITCAPDEPGARVCMCECASCKRPWHEMGRPLLRDGKIIFSGGPK